MELEAAADFLRLSEKTLRWSMTCTKAGPESCAGISLETVGVRACWAPHPGREDTAPRGPLQLGGATRNTSVFMINSP